MSTEDTEVETVWGTMEPEVGHWYRVGGELYSECTSHSQEDSLMGLSARKNKFQNEKKENSDIAPGSRQQQNGGQA